MLSPSEEIFNQYSSQTAGYNWELDRESQSLQSLNFDKAKKKMNNHSKMGPPLHEKMTDIIYLQ